jgi:2-C-methyl-D-erythritol 2,4-cyclodiphosphate synthase
LFRVGNGYDLHRLVGGRPLILGGVNIPYPMGLEGYSDADVLLHALMDALLGAAGLKDIGHHFPPGDPRFLNISSIILLREVKSYLERDRFRLLNADTVLIAQAPRISPYLEQMQANIAGVLNASPDCISIKATTTEGIGACGRGEAIAAQAVVLLERISC